MYSLNGGFMTTSQAAKFLGLSKCHVLDLIKMGKIRARVTGEGPTTRYFLYCSSVEALRRKRQRDAQKPQKLKAYLKNIKALRKQ